MGGPAESPGSLKENTAQDADDYGGGWKPCTMPETVFTVDNSYFENIVETAKFISFKQEEIAVLNDVTRTYPMRIPRYYFSLIQEINDPYDPVRRQCVPAAEEIHAGAGGDIDPLGEEKMSPVPYLVHRYPDRALLLVTNQCFMFCRHCTRKRIWRHKHHVPTLAEIEPALDYVRRHTDIREVIVSGGDPLTLPTKKLDCILSSLASINHLEVIRIGTRAPVVFPQRVDEPLCAALVKYGNLWVNVQFNHPREITPLSTAACRKLQAGGIPVSNQTVLLKGVNDTPAVMIELCRKLQSIRVRPYYLFACDPVVGAAHFRVPVAKGIDIIKNMRGYTSGMCVPAFVVDGVDGKGKVTLGPDYAVSLAPSGGGILLKNYRDELFFYPEPAPEPGRVSESKAGMVRTIGIIFNLKKNVTPGSDEQEEYDEAATIDSLKKEVERLGFGVCLFEQNQDLVLRLREVKPDFVLNIAEGTGRGRAREAQVPALLESLQIPYSGPDPVALGVTLDKWLTQRLLRSAGLPVPDIFMVEDLKTAAGLENIFAGNKLFIVKPRWEGSSKGIFSDSVVGDFSSLAGRITRILTRYKQPAVVEEFIAGGEVTVGVGGGCSPRILGMMQIVPRDKCQENFFYSLEVKRDWQAKVDYLPESSLSAAVRKQAAQYACAAYGVLELKDLARIDFRVGRGGVPKIIDVNALPGLSPRYSDLPILYRLRGGSYSDLIRNLLRDSFARYNLKADI